MCSLAKKGRVIRPLAEAGARGHLQLQVRPDERPLGRRFLAPPSGLLGLPMSRG